MNGAKQETFTPFDDLRHMPDAGRRADIIFGPDMFDPSIVDGYAPLTDALHAAAAEGRLADLGVDESSFEKTVGEVWSGLEPGEIRERLLEVSNRLEPQPPARPMRKSWLRRLVPFAS